MNIWTLAKAVAFGVTVSFVADIWAAIPYEDIMQMPERAAGIYHAYPVTETRNTPPPSGFVPVYISHMGRHGSRYLLRQWEYDDMRAILDAAHDAGALTETGNRVRNDFMVVYEEADGHAGDLSPLGVRQHKGIAERMYAAYPEVFSGLRKVNAVSTMIMRCGMSMAAFCEQLKVLNPELDISRDPSERHMRYIMYNSDGMKAYNSDAGPWKEEFRKLREKWIPTDRIINMIFADSVYVRRHVNPTEFVWMLYNVASNMQNVENPRPFIDLFTHDELYSLWRTENFRMYAHYSTYAPAGDVVINSSKPLLRKIMEQADASLAAGDIAADLRFGHDINIIPLAGLMGLQGCSPVVDDPERVHEVFQDYNFSPKASNIQLIFFRNGNGEVIVKFMLNEREIAIPCKTDIYPFYRWVDVKEYYAGILSE